MFHKFDDEDAFSESGGFDEWEPSAEEIAQIKRAMQDANDGFTYRMLNPGVDWSCECNKCGRVGDLLEKPFPHKLDCEMRARIKD